MGESRSWGVNIRYASQDVILFLWNSRLLLHVQKSPFLVPILGLRIQPLPLHDAGCLTVTDVTGITDAQKHIPCI
jgi:hypothetical protein